MQNNSSMASRPLLIGKTSLALSKCGIPLNQNITITKNVLKKSLREEKRDSSGKMIGKNGHGLTIQQIIDSLLELDYPTLVFKGTNNNSLLIITEVKDNKNRNIVIAISVNHQENFSFVSSIRSIYGRDNINYYIEENIKKGNLLLLRKEKADKLLHSIEKSYLKENTFISY